MLHKIISGCQNKTEVAGLQAALDCGYQTGGTMPKGCKTLDGPRPQYIIKYGMKESISANYSVRTEQNVIDSDATIRIACDFNSPGERCTLRHLKYHGKDYFDVHVSSGTTVKHKEQLFDEFRTFCKKKKVIILNVAGNSEDTCPGIERLVYDLMVYFLTRLREVDDES